MGTEPFFIDQITTALTGTVVEEMARDFDTTIVYGKETTVDQIVRSQAFPHDGKSSINCGKGSTVLGPQH